MIAIVYITCSNEEEAIKIGKHIVEERLGGCSNIINNMKSIYWWENTVEEDEEVVLLIKTLDEKVKDIIKRVKELHSYDNPCILAIPTISHSDSYYEWLKEEIN